MSRSSCSSRRSSAALLLWLTVVALPVVAMAPLPELPFVPRQVGAGNLRHFGIQLYGARLWNGDGLWKPDAPYALELIYARSFTAEAIAERSIVEIRRQGIDDALLLANWQTRLRALFPDVAAGDRLLGLRQPGAGATFYLGERQIGRIDDEQLAAAFFAIWVGEQSSAPGLRRRLLGLP